MYQPIENYGVIGNMRTVALAGMDGSIDWFCFPDIDSPSIFGAILDDKKGGRFRLAPIDQNIRRKQFYWPSTNILVTRFFSDAGIVELQDFMPLRRGATLPGSLYRRIRGVRGKVRIRMECQPAFNYGRDSHDVHICDHGARFVSKALGISLSASVPVQNGSAGSAWAEFDLEQGQEVLFILAGCTDASHAPPCPCKEEAEQLFLDTATYWRQWLSRCNYHGRWREQVHRSALMLKLLTYEPTGAIVAAPTCSLPEAIGGERNWDYRYCWIRDSAFTVYAFVRLGFTEEAAGFVDWMRKYTAINADPEGRARTLLTVRGHRSPPEEILSHWEGYMGSGPVRIGNAAADQFQNDIYGEALDSVYLYNKHVTPVPYDFWTTIRGRIDWLCDHWQQPDCGIWEFRDRMENFTYSKLMNWVALDRGIRLAEKRSFPADRARWITERDKIYEEIMTRAWDPKLNAFTQSYGNGQLDASLLIMPMVFFMAPGDPRMLGTLDAILKDPRDGGLVSDSLVYRYPPGEDNLHGSEGTFNMCSFWLVEALTRAGQADPAKLDQGRIIFERMMGYANHLGLYAEQTGHQGQALGNFPQAFTHLALISSAFNLDRTLGTQP